MSDDAGWIPRGFDGTPGIIAAWKKQQDDYHSVAVATAAMQRNNQLLLFLSPPPYIAIFTAAKRLLDAGEFGAAVVLAQTACEVLGANVLERLMKKRSVELLRDWIVLGATRQNASFSSNVVRELYVALSGDRIQGEPFWAKYLEHVRRRNEVAHQGKTVSKPEAEDSYQAAESFIRHLEGVIVTQSL